MTPKQEAFALKYVETGCASTAYRAAYDAQGMKDSVVHVKASELLKNGKVTVRVAEIQARHQERHDITVDKLTHMAVKAYDLAMNDEVQTPSAAVAAVMALGKLHGLIVDKTKHSGDAENPVVLQRVEIHVVDPQPERTARIHATPHARPI